MNTPFVRSARVLGAAVSVGDVPSELFGIILYSHSHLGAFGVRRGVYVTCNNFWPFTNVLKLHRNGHILLEDHLCELRWLQSL